MDDAKHLQKAIEALHECSAIYETTVPISETFQGQTAWEGTVYSFILVGHPKTTRCYAWSSPIEGSENRKVFAVLELPPVTSAADAVKASIVAEHKTQGRSDAL